MLEPVNTVLKGVERLGLQAGDRVWVAGLGPVGLMFTRVLALAGVEVVGSDLLKERMQLARALGAVEVVDASSGRFREQLLDWARGGFDAVVLAVPVDQLVGQAMEAVRGGGRVLLFAHTQLGAAVSVDLGGVCALEKDLIGSYSSDFTLQEKSAELVFSRRLDVRALISHRFGLESAVDAIRTASKPGAETLKVIVTAGGEE